MVFTIVRLRPFTGSTLSSVRITLSGIVVGGVGVPTGGGADTCGAGGCGVWGAEITQNKRGKERGEVDTSTSSKNLASPTHILIS